MESAIAVSLYRQLPLHLPQVAEEPPERFHQTLGDLCVTNRVHRQTMAGLRAEISSPIQAECACLMIFSAFGRDLVPTARGKIEAELTIPAGPPGPA